jgi:hypothetical protein
MPQSYRLLMSKSGEGKTDLLLRAERLVQRNLAYLEDTKLRVHESLTLVRLWRSSAFNGTDESRRRATKTSQSPAFPSPEPAATEPLRAVK